MPAMTRFSPPSLAMAVGFSQPVAPKLAIQARLPVGLNMLRNPLYQFGVPGVVMSRVDRKSTRLNSSHANISYAVFCLKKKENTRKHQQSHTRYNTVTRHCVVGASA